MGFWNRLLGEEKRLPTSEAPKARLQVAFEKHLAATSRKSGHLTLADLMVIAALSTSLGVVQWKKELVTCLGDAQFGGISDDLVLFEATAWFCAEILGIITCHPLSDVERKGLYAVFARALHDVAWISKEVVPDGLEVLLNRAHTWPLAPSLAIEWFYAAIMSSQGKSRPATKEQVEEMLPKGTRLLPSMSIEEFTKFKQIGPPMTHWDDLPLSVSAALGLYLSEIHLPGVLKTSNMIKEAMDRLVPNR